jgi:death-on-curing protein
MREPRWVPRVVIEAIHFDQIRTHGGLAGVRDESALESALARPRNRWAYSRRPDLARLAAAYAFGLARDHPFRDGNKRVAFLAAVVFLELNGYELVVSDDEVVARMVALAAGRLSESTLAAWIRDRIHRKPTKAA